MRNQILIAPESHQPAVLFEQRHGLKGIAGHYNFPDVPGWDWKSLDERFNQYFDRKADPELYPKLVENFAKASGKPATLENVRPGGALRKPMLRYLIELEHEEITRIYHALADLNPGAAAQLHFDPNNRAELSTAVQGLVSGFNTDDINYFIGRSRRGNEEQYSQRDVVRAAADKKIIARLGLEKTHSLGWIASPETQKKIWNQIKHRPMSLEGPDGPADAPLHDHTSPARAR